MPIVFVDIDNTVMEIIRKALNGEDHRDIVIDKIDEAFVKDVIAFFEQVVIAKIRNEEISLSWYKDHFLNEDLTKSDIIWNAGYNIKSVDNKRGTTRKSVVIEEALLHHDKFVELIDSLTDKDIDINLSLTMRSATVHLTLNESLVVINALAVRRAAIRGAAWSSVGKHSEQRLMDTLCRLFSVNEKYAASKLPNVRTEREVDYYLLPPDTDPAKCEVKLMGKGNPESMDAVRARDSRVFVASTLSAANKAQLDGWGVLWTELQTPNGFLRFGDTLRQLGIPCTDLLVKADYTEEIEYAIQSTFAV